MVKPANSFLLFLGLTVFWINIESLILPVVLGTGYYGITQFFFMVGFIFVVIIIQKYKFTGVSVDTIYRDLIENIDRLVRG